MWPPRCFTGVAGLGHGDLFSFAHQLGGHRARIRRGSRILGGAIRRLHADEPQLARLLEVQFIGRIAETELPAFEGTEALGVHCRGFLEHREMLPALAASHAVLCLRYTMEHGAPSGYVDDLYVTPAFRRQQVASRLLQALVDE